MASSGVTSPTSMRDNVAKEILESEKTFVDQMQVLVKVFAKPLKWWAQELKANYGKGSMHPTLPENFLFEIFANLEQLLVFNQHIVSEFTEIYNTTKAFGAYFKKAAPFFKMYSAYVSNYDRAMETLTQLCDTRLDFASFLRACELQEQCKGLNLRSFLIMPVQRIPRYKLLLSELLKHTPVSHPDYADLKAAVDLVSNVSSEPTHAVKEVMVVNSINEDIKRQERRFKVVDVQEKFGTSLVTASRIFVRDGELIKMCRKGPKRFLFVLFNDLMVYGSERIGSQSSYSLHRKIELNELYLVDSGEDQRSFIVATKVKSFVVQCKDIPEKKEWLAAISSCFAEMDKSYAYRNARSNKESRFSSILLWMVREGKMVREMYWLPDTDKVFGMLALNQLRLVVDPQQVGPEPGSGFGSRVRSLFRGSSAQMKVGIESPVPCEPIIHVPMDMYEDDDASVSTEATSEGNRLSLDLRDVNRTDNQADLLYLGDMYPANTPPKDGSPPLQQRQPSPQQQAGGVGMMPTIQSGGIPQPISARGSASSAAGVATVVEMGAGNAMQQGLPIGFVTPTQPLSYGNSMNAPQRPVSMPLSSSSSSSYHQQQQQQEISTSGSGHHQRVRDLQEQSIHLFQQEAAADGTQPTSHVAADAGARRRPQGANVSFEATASVFGGQGSLPIRGEGMGGGDGGQRMSTNFAQQPSRRPSSQQQQPRQPSQATQALNGVGSSNSSINIRESDPYAFPPTASESTPPPQDGEYVAVIPVTEMGLGLFLKDENGEVVIGGFRSPRSGMGVNPSQRAGVKLGDVLIRVNGVLVTTVAQTIAALRESRMEQVIALTLRKSAGGGSNSTTMRKSLRSPTRTFRSNTTSSRIVGS